MKTTVDEKQAEAKRLARRRFVREQLAQIELTKRKIADVDSQIRTIDNRLELHAAKHLGTCGPLQEELQAVEARIVTALTDRVATKPADEKSRTSLIKQIADANEELQKAVTTENALLAPLKRERQRLIMQTIEEQGLRNKLAQPECGKPEWLDELFVANNASTWATARRGAAQGKLNDFIAERQAAAQRREASNVAHYDRVLRRCQLELAAAQAASTIAQQHSDAVHKKLLDE